MLRPSCLILVFLGMSFCFSLSYALFNPALATGPMGPNASDKATDLTAQQSNTAASPLRVKGDYGRLPERFIVNRGQADERVQIYMKGERQTICINDKRLLDKDRPKQNLRLRPLVKGEYGKNETKNEQATGANPDGANVAEGYVATVTGPGELSFFWKVSCEPRVAYLEATLDGEQVSKISGEIDWSLQNLTIPAGTHTIGWLYRKNGDSNFGADRGWLHEVEFTATKAPDNL